MNEEQLDKLKAILIDISAEQASRETSGEKWFSEIVEAINDL